MARTTNPRPKSGGSSTRSTARTLRDWRSTLAGAHRGTLLALTLPTETMVEALIDKRTPPAIAKTIDDLLTVVRSGVREVDLGFFVGRVLAECSNVLDDEYMNQEPIPGSEIAALVLDSIEVEVIDGRD